MTNLGRAVCVFMIVGRVQAGFRCSLVRTATLHRSQVDVDSLTPFLMLRRALVIAANAG